MKLKKLSKELLEKDIEQYLCREIKKLGGTAYKFTTPARRSVPDRLCLLPGGIAVFIECKRPGKRLSDAQENKIAELQKLGFDVTWVDTKERVNEEIERIKCFMSEKEEI